MQTDHLSYALNFKAYMTRVTWQEPHIVQGMVFLSHKDMCTGLDMTGFLANWLEFEACTGFALD